MMRPSESTEYQSLLGPFFYERVGMRIYEDYCAGLVTVQECDRAFQSLNEITGCDPWLARPEE